MSDLSVEVVGIGNAIVDVLAQVDDAFLSSVGLVKGSMTLVDADQSARIYDRLPPAVEMSGGSAGNTIAGVASLGGRAAYIGKVKDDQLGQVYRHDMRAIGARFETAPGKDSAPTARSMILVTPDAQRTMATYLGACVELGPQDLDIAAIEEAAITYMEGYLFDPPDAQRAFYEAAKLAHAKGRQVSLTLSDSFCVHRHGGAFREFIDGHVDVLFANEAELLALTTEGDFDRALAALKGKVSVAAVTRSEKGSVVLKGDEVVTVDAAAVSKVVDTTGAGDLYAAGFLLGHVRGFAAADCGALGSLAAAEVISHLGPRPQTSLKALANRHLTHLPL
ncbi:adenosine kinase [Lacibacterium aquatile]|uniref:Adenosine kinase n=1 Tax=Lacibacterium aquatile TaxID=1168082 RepID=A0ABW5DVC9_9PROT